ncbi:MAG: sulfatase [Opitutus sp.]|nr:sulfatase [Opitutus sp.]
MLGSFFALLFSVPLAPAPAAAAVVAPRPNIVVVISDDQGWEDYSFMGHPHIATPALDKLAAQSLTFTRGYSPVPLCRPSLSSIATGLYPHQHGVTGNDPTLPDAGVNAQTGRADPKYARYYNTIIENFHSRPNFIRDLTSRSYRSFETGKWWEGDPVKSAGFSEAMTVGTAKGDRHGGIGLEIGRQGLAPITQFIEKSGTQPWLVWYAPMLPHAPHTPPADLLAKYLKLAPSEPVARYWASVEWFDRTCGELLGYLDKKGLRENTIVLYTTDNGWIQNPEVANRFAPRSKLTPYEGGHRTPIMISWPGRVAPRMDRDHLASNIDLWPTLAALLKTPLPKSLPGLDLTDAKAVAARTTIHGEQYAHNIADVGAPTRSLEHRWIIHGWSKLIVPDARNVPNGKPELFDLQSDPWEKSDLAAKQPERVRELRKKLDTWWTPPVAAK